ncbi:hypothetical protein SPSIL_005860 [Sporomusa silvacetica DSM 10669]|uniref:Cyclic lactone autoinducer peptide n=1 Tax=Sporomusa silvacetica DSM 10669 TaxID=1123289 RepID=A0ABZ3IGD1_9FIRM|nr:hypothetical protein [Sporomusa silvacetica]OZC17089.1 hypothetical protein SPSIL_34540 [Sporomusa silvacetica DSM 10669]
MKRKTEQSVIVVFVMGVMFSFYSMCAAIYTMTDEQYACKAQEIVNYSLPLCQPPTNSVE